MAAAEDEAKEAVPACVIMPTGPSVPALTTLVSELRRVMAPNTPEKLKQRKRQTSLEDMMHATLPLGVTHFMLLSQRGPRTQLRLLRAPSGPTLTFRVQQYSLTRGVRAQPRRRLRDGRRVSMAEAALLSREDRGTGQGEHCLGPVPVPV